MIETLHEDENGKITGRQDYITQSVILKVEYKGLNSESITIPREAISNVRYFLSKLLGFRS